MSNADQNLVALINTDNYKNILNYINDTKNLNPYADDADDCSILFWSIFHHKSINTIKALIESNVDFYFPNKEGFTPLMVAAQENRLDIVKLILKKNPSCLNETDKKNQNALYYSVNYTGNYKVAYLLIKKGITTNIKNIYGLTSLDRAFDMSKDKPLDKCFEKSINIIQNYDSIVLKKNLDKNLGKNKNDDKKIKKI